MRKSFSTFAAAILTGLLTSHVQAQDLGECHSFDDEDLRLECYDRESDYTPPEAQISTPTIGGWVLIEQIDDFTNANTSFAMLDSDASSRFMTDAAVAVIARCTESGSHEIYVKSGGYIGARNDMVPVRYRFGDDPPISERWHESTTGTAAFLPRGYRDFKTGLQSGQDFVFEITDYNGTSYRSKFENVAVNIEALEFVLGNCKR